MTPKPMLSEGEYLDLVGRIQQAMAIEPFRPSMADVVTLIGEWRLQHHELDRLRAAWAAVKESWWQGDSEQAVAYMELDTLLGVDSDGKIVGHNA